MKVHKLKLRLSNAYLLIGQRPILVDTGSPGEAIAIRRELESLGVSLTDLALIAHTHAHSDHMGNTQELKQIAKCPVAYHPDDQPLIEQSHNGQLRGVGLRGKVMSRFFSGAKFAAVPADVALISGLSLVDYGVDAEILCTPGHTPGSVSVVTRSGEALIGDLLMGGYMGGALFPARPNLHYFAENPKQNRESLKTLLSKTSGKLYPGHGGPLAHETVTVWFS